MCSLGRNTAETDASNRFRGYLAGAVFILGGWLADVATDGTCPLDLLSLRALWSVILLLCALLEHQRFNPLVVGAVGSIGSVVAATLLALADGGSTSGFLWLLSIIPVLMSQMDPDRRGLTLMASAGALAGGLVVAAFERAPVFAIGWVIWSCFFGWWAVLGLRRLRSLRDAELAAERRAFRMERERTEALDDRARALASLAVAEKRRSRNERLAAVGRLAAGVAHEINNPLAFVKSNLELVIAEAKDPLVREAMQDSLTGVQQIEQIVQDLRSLARETGNGVERVDVARTVEEACRLASVRLRTIARVEREIPPDLPPLHCGKGRLLQVLINLLVNASDALEQNGRAGDSRIVVGARHDGDFLQLWVEDNGPGVPREIADHIFDPFFTTKEHASGMGIGLTLSREFVEGLGGSLRLKTGALGGARFVLTIPLTSGKQAAA